MNRTNTSSPTSPKIKNAIAVPGFLHDVFGEQQSLLELLAIIVLGTSITLAVVPGDQHDYAGVAAWRKMVAWVIFADIAAGSVANFSRGTNDYYAARATNRWIFISIHVHLLAIAWLLNVSMTPALACWAYTIVSAIIVNTLAGHRHQTFVAACFVIAGLIGLMFLAQDSLTLTAASLLFLVKVTFSFAVNHYAGEKSASPASTPS